MTDPWDVPQTERPQHQQLPMPEPQQPRPVVVTGPQRQKNAVAVAGLITSVIPGVGLLLSVVGCIRAKALGGAGRRAGTLGIALSVLFTTALGFGIYVIDQNSGSTDPGCVAYEQVGLSMNSTLEEDSESMSSANTSSNAAQKSAAQQKSLADAGSVQAATDNAEKVAQRSNVKAALATANGDLRLFTSQFSQYIADGSGAASLMTTAESMITDGKAVMSACGAPGS